MVKRAAKPPKAKKKPVRKCLQYKECKCATAEVAVSSLPEPMQDLIEQATGYLCLPCARNIAKDIRRTKGYGLCASHNYTCCAVGAYIPYRKLNGVPRRMGLHAVEETWGRPVWAPRQSSVCGTCSREMALAQMEDGRYTKDHPTKRTMTYALICCQYPSKRSVHPAQTPKLLLHPAQNPAQYPKLLLHPQVASSE
eukprot:gene4717-2342_t